MTTLEWDLAVGNALTECAVARGGRIDKIESQVFLRQLADLSADLIVRACHELGNEARQAFETYVPPAPVIRERCAQIQRRDAMPKPLALPPASSSGYEPTFACHRCLDTTWLQPMRCPDQRRCERVKEHPAHTFTARCPCFLRRHADRLALMKQDALKDNREIPIDCEWAEQLQAGTYRWGMP